jgi:MraZ protein
MAELPEQHLPPCEFFGQYRLKLDEKGRLTLPSICRKALPEGAEPTFILRQGDDEFVQMIPLYEFKQLRQRRQKVDTSGRSLQWQARNFYGGVESTSLDPKGRFKIPESLVAGNHFEEEVLVVGVGRILELWRPETFFAEQQKFPDASADIDDLYQ